MLMPNKCHYNSCVCIIHYLRVRTLQFTDIIIIIIIVIISIN